ncbi:MAG: saccharopine dehydrogenase NADP-binding domain-containing protein [Mariniphaga sp.]|nr:saccharopine dehydrogenase NADP-binding domain-containing protein [Mariniphaga sp.]
MKKILLLGSGMVAKPLVDYLLEHKFNLTIATRTKSKAEKLIRNRNNGTAIAWNIEDTVALEGFIVEHDLVVSLLPYTHHVTVAKLCIKYKKNMVTTSYVSPQMEELDSVAKKSGIIILNEIGVDPGYDHMTAMSIIDKVHSEGGKIKEFYSLCGALAAPEHADNPFKYKFSWSPKGVVMAGNNGAKYLKDRSIVEISTKNLFKNPLQIEFPEVGLMEVYPNRDSLSYIDIYKLPEIETMYRGTFRYPNWCESMDAIKAINMVSYEKLNFEGKTYADVTALQIGEKADNIKEQVALKLGIQTDSLAIESMEWLGLFSNRKIPIKEGSTFDLTSDLMLEKMMLPENSRDMVIMMHSFLVEKSDGSKEVIKSRLLDFATDKDTSIARTVALPAAIAVEMILKGEINETGVHIPVKKSIYKPVLQKLRQMGIEMEEEFGLPANEKLN